jgi:hypothetical protein
MAATPSIRIIKEFTYRGSVRRFSNRYHFNGGTPGDPTEWGTLATNVIDSESTIFHPDVTIVGWQGMAAGSDVPVASDTVSVVGVASFANTYPAPGDCAYYLRWSTTARTTKNHPIYLGNFFHGARYDSTDPPDALTAGTIAALEAYGAAWVAGFSDGVHTCVRAGPNGATGGTVHADAFVTHRDFPH